MRRNIWVRSWQRHSRGLKLQPARVALRQIIAAKPKSATADRRDLEIENGRERAAQVRWAAAPRGQQQQKGSAESYLCRPSSTDLSSYFRNFKLRIASCVGRTSGRRKWHAEEVHGVERAVAQHFAIRLARLDGVEAIASLDVSMEEL